MKNTVLSSVLLLAATQSFTVTAATNVEKTSVSEALQQESRLFLNSQLQNINTQIKLTIRTSTQTSTMASLNDTAFNTAMKHTTITSTAGTSTASSSTVSAPIQENNDKTSITDTVVSDD